MKRVCSNGNTQKANDRSRQGLPEEAMQKANVVKDSWRADKIIYRVGFSYSKASWAWLERPGPCMRNGRQAALVDPGLGRLALASKTELMKPATLLVYEWRSDPPCCATCQLQHVLGKRSIREQITVRCRSISYINIRTLGDLL